MSQGTDEFGENSEGRDGNRWWFGNAKSKAQPPESVFSSFSPMKMSDSQFKWYEFFAGGGMARLGLGAKWNCIFSNDWCEKKASAYRGHFGPSEQLKVADVAKLTLKDLPGTPDLIWASFPCQDLSLAGAGAGLRGERSGTFRPFWSLVEGMVNEGRAPSLIVLENVVGTLTSHSGADFASIIGGFGENGYRAGALVVDAVRFLPQSRPRLFVIGVHDEINISPKLLSAGPSESWHSTALIRAHNNLSPRLTDNWIWWSLPTPHTPIPALISLMEEPPTGVNWHSEADTRKLLGLMNPAHRQKVSAAIKVGGRHVGTIYKRTRPNKNEEMVQRAEVRFDGVSGCLRTPVGGSSRQTVILVENGRIRTRLLSPREAARLMGVPENYPMPAGYNDAYHVFGDGVVVPVVSWLEKYLLRPLMQCRTIRKVA
jgi:DNA (cytosine-5)-methyltransferase 1